VGNDSIWQLRVVGQAGSTVAFASQNAGGAANKCRLKPNEYLCVQTDSGMGGGVNSIPVSTFVPGSPGLGKVVLERLADPSKPWESTATKATFNPYIAVDEAALVIAADQASATRQIRDDAAFWTGRQWTAGAAGDTAPAVYAKKIPWFHWPNRPFVGAAELALVPTGDASLMLASGTVPSPARKKSNLILDAVHVPSRFVGGAQRIGDNATLQATATNEEVCTTMLPRWREPGRINVNTVVANPNNAPSQLDNGVWQALLGAGAGSVNGGTNPFLAGQSARSMGDMLALQQSGTGVFYEPEDAALPARNNNEFFRYARAIRLSNDATVRSHVFAVWITLRITDTSPAASAPVYRRMFAIVDRSIPVGFTRGETLNVRDTVRLQRFLD
jgi:hypothetical protein